VEINQVQLILENKMLKITSNNLIKRLATWRDEIEDVDWGDDEATEHPINEDNFEDFLVDDIEESQEFPDQTRYEAPLPGDWRDELPTTNEYLTPDAERELEYSDPERLVSDAISHVDENGLKAPEVIGFEYINRHGFYAGHRIVEPHYTFLANTTGNLVLVSFDRGERDIRAFIVRSKTGKGGIQPNGVRYEGEVFRPKDEIMIGTAAMA